MRQLKCLSLISIATAFVLPAVERSGSLIKTWHPVQVSRFGSRDAEHTGFSNVVARYRILADFFELELSGQVYSQSFQLAPVSDKSLTIRQPDSVSARKRPLLHPAVFGSHCQTHNGMIGTGNV